MKRNPVLQPLSREHHTALTLANACARAAQAGDAAMLSQACQRAIRALAIELEPHFRIEEQQLLPLLKSPDTQALVQRTLTDHEQLRGLLTGLQQNDVEALNSFGKYLYAHVRFEERELFPVIESLL
ncbi:MAG TPA: hemerythrin domain-containing protein [Gallionellaceae bacterium]|nr:hemerythrin domain-containing protein [Gallionellaceae bacterium]